MPESVLSVAKVLLFGQVIADIVVKEPVPLAPVKPPSKKPKSEDPKPGADGLHSLLKGGQFARIYGFSYDGQYFDMVRPALFLVHGDGEPVTADTVASGHVSNPARAPRSPEVSGVSVASFQFSDAIRVWSYDKFDYTIRMDVETGQFEQVLLQVELDDEALDAFMSGQRARLSGQRARVSGQRARVSGQRARVNNPRGD